MRVRPEDSTIEGERALERIDLIGVAGLYLRRFKGVPAALLFKLYGTTRLDMMSRSDLLDFIERGRMGELPTKDFLER